MTPRASVGGRERLRLFCALRLPDETVSQHVEWQREVFATVRARVVPHENLHVTLAFLGPRPSAELEQIREALRSTAVEAERPLLAASRYRETRSVGMVVLDDEGRRAMMLAEDLQRRLEQLGVYQRERRPWLPHVTVLRFHQRPRLSPYLPDLGAVSPSEAALYHSVLRPRGAQYEVIESVALGG